MSFIIGALALVLILIYSVLLRKIYQIPLKELRRRARSGSANDKKLYTVASFEHGLKMFSWLLTCLSAAGLFLIVAHHAHLLIATLSLLILIWLVFDWLPARRWSGFGKKVLIISAPLLFKLLSWLQPLSSWLEIKLRRFASTQVHSGLYERDDLIELLHRQATLPDNRISKEELKMAVGSLQFGDTLVRSVMTPRRVLKTVNAEDMAGPYLMDKLHKTGFSRFPVVKEIDGQKQYVGTLFLKDLLRFKQGATVGRVMQPEVYYVNDEQNLRQVLHAAAKTKHHMFLVVNNFEEVVGVITIEDVIEQILGQKITDEFDQYDDLRAVASLQADKEHKQHHEFHPTPQNQRTEQ